MSNPNRHDAKRWFSAEIGDVVHVVPRRLRTAPAGAGAAPGTPPDAARGAGTDVELTTGLQRWSRRLARQRSLAVMRRQLLAAGVLALIAALIILIAGGARPWWLAVAAAGFALACGAVTRLRRPSLAAAAQLVDRALGLNDRLGTALELQSAGADRGLARLVRNEAQAAIGPSLAAARARPAPAAREWAWLAVVACALALVIALPRGAGGGHVGGAGGAAAVAGAKAGAKGGRSGAAPKLPAGTIPALASPNVPLTSTNAQGQSVDPYRHPGKEYHNPAQPAVSDLSHIPPVSLAAAHGLSTPGGSGGHSGSGGTGGSSGSGHSSAAPGSKLGSGGTKGLQPAGGSHHPGAATKPTSSLSDGHKGAGAAGGGESAGSAKAKATGQSAGITPQLSNGQTNLPLQGGFKPIAGKGRGSTGSSPTQQGGGGGPSKTANVNGGGSGTGGFAALAPDYNAPGADSSLLDYYFGTANQMRFKGW